jgi:ParB family chromosome partitioning protein
MKISLDNIAADPKQPRKEFDRAELELLANSIEQNGLMQPITVRPRDKESETFWIVAGERRYRAHCLLRDRGARGFSSIEVLVKKPPTVADLRVRQIVENIARADLKPLEEARAYQDLIDTGMGVFEAAKRLGVPSNRVESRLSLLNLTAEIQTMLAGEQLSKPQALELARLPNQADQTRLVKMLNRGELGAWKSLKAAVDIILAGKTQEDMFGGATISDEEVATINAMERKIEALANTLASGWKNGECVIATKVSPDRASHMADKLAAIRQSVRHMEQQLRNVTAQAKMVLAS